MKDQTSTPKNNLFDYHRVECTNNLNSADSIFTYFIQKEEEILSWDPNQLIDLYKIIPRDNGCMYGMGEEKNSEYTHSEKNYGMCLMCKSLSKLFNPEEHILEPVKIHCGEHRGKYVKIIKTDYKKIFIRNSGEHKKQILGCPCEDSEKCEKVIGPPGSSVKIIPYIGSDLFTNGFLINILLSKKLSSQETVRKIYGAFICQDNAYIVAENVDYDSLEDMFKGQGWIDNEKVDLGINELDFENTHLVKLVSGIFSQVIVSFHKISNTNFNYNRVSHDCFSFKNESNNYNYSDIKVRCPVKLKLQGFEYSSIDHKGSRIFHDPDYLRIFKYSHSLTPSLITMSLSVDGTIVNLFKITTETIQLYYFDQINKPILPSAINLYVSLIVLMSNKIFYTVVNKNPDLYKIWRGIFVGSMGYRLVEKRIEYLHGKNVGFIDAIEVLRNVYLRCDACEYAIRKLSKIN